MRDYKKSLILRIRPFNLRPMSDEFDAALKGLCDIFDEAGDDNGDAKARAVMEEARREMGLPADASYSDIFKTSLARMEDAIVQIDESLSRVQANREDIKKLREAQLMAEAAKARTAGLIH